MLNGGDCRAAGLQPPALPGSAKKGLSIWHESASIRGGGGGQTSHDIASSHLLNAGSSWWGPVRP